MDAHSQLYTRQSNHCEFTISAFESASGVLESPRHTLPPRAVCRYNFQGRRHEIVWISFVKYHSAVDQSLFEAPAECSPQLRIWDGKLRTHSKMGEYKVLFGGSISIMVGGVENCVKHHGYMYVTVACSEFGHLCAELPLRWVTW